MTLIHDQLSWVNTSYPETRNHSNLAANWPLNASTYKQIKLLIRLANIILDFTLFQIYSFFFFRRCNSTLSSRSFCFCGAPFRSKRRVEGKRWLSVPVPGSWEYRSCSSLPPVQLGISDSILLALLMFPFYRGEAFIRKLEQIAPLVKP